MPRAARLEAGLEMLQCRANRLNAALIAALAATSSTTSRGRHGAALAAEEPRGQAVPRCAGLVFRGFPIHAFATACQVARSPVRIRPIRSAPESFYVQASNGSVALPVAGYDYNSDWTPLLAGLSPARMAASLAAPDPYGPNSGIRSHLGCLTAKRASGQG